LGGRFQHLLTASAVIVAAIELHVRGVGHEVESLSEVWSTDPTRAKIRRPNGVTRSFQVSRYSVEPSESSLSRNLLSKDDWRTALLDEPKEVGPEMSFVIGSFSFTCN
jgi:hypothetical protein